MGYNFCKEHGDAKASSGALGSENAGEDASSYDAG